MCRRNTREHKASDEDENQASSMSDGDFAFTPSGTTRHAMQTMRVWIWITSRNIPIYTSMYAYMAQASRNSRK